MKTITATIPDRSGLEIEYLLKIGAYRIEIAVRLYTDGKISLGKAAELAGISFDEMKEVLVQRGVEPKLGIETIREAVDDIDALKDVRIATCRKN